MAAKPPVDPKIAAILSSVFAVLGVFGVFERLGLTADDTAILVGALGALATTIRAVVLGHTHRKAVRAEADVEAGILPANDSAAAGTDEA